MLFQQYCEIDFKDWNLIIFLLFSVALHVWLALLKTEERTKYRRRLVYSPFKMDFVFYFTRRKLLLKMCLLDRGAHQRSVQPDSCLRTHPYLLLCHSCYPAHSLTGFYCDFLVYVTKNINYFHTKINEFMKTRRLLFSQHLVKAYFCL